MFAFTHAIAGAALGALAGGPAGAFVTGVVSHAVLDAVPHWDYRTTGAGVADGSAAILTAGLLASAAAEPMWVLAGAAGGLLPDLEVAMRTLGRWPFRRLFFPSHSGLTPHLQAGPLWGTAVQLLVTAAAAGIFWGTG